MYFILYWDFIDEILFKAAYCKLRVEKLDDRQEEEHRKSNEQSDSAACFEKALIGILY